MQIQIVSIGTRPSSWIQEGFEDYCGRLPREYQLKLIEIPTPKRMKSTNINKLMDQESELILKAIPSHHIAIALDRNGKLLDTTAIASKMNEWKQQSLSVSFIIGGPDGLSTKCLAKAHEKWSLSNLTFPHALVRVILAEQIYRAWSILANHPYHR